MYLQLIVTAFALAGVSVGIAADLNTKPDPKLNPLVLCQEFGNLDVVACSENQMEVQVKSFLSSQTDKNFSKSFSTVQQTFIDGVKSFCGLATNSRQLGQDGEPSQQDLCKASFYVARAEQLGPLAPVGAKMESLLQTGSPVVAVKNIQPISIPLVEQLFGSFLKSSCALQKQAPADKMTASKCAAQTAATLATTKLRTSQIFEVHPGLPLFTVEQVWHDWGLVAEQNIKIHRWDSASPTFLQELHGDTDLNVFSAKVDKEDPLFETLDFNHDGYSDLRLRAAQGKHEESFLVWLFDHEKSVFVFDRELSDIPNLDVTEDGRLVTSSFLYLPDGGLQRLVNEYAYEAGKVSLISERQENLPFEEDAALTWKVSVKKPDGSAKIVCEAEAVRGSIRVLAGERKACGDVPQL